MNCVERTLIGLNQFECIWVGSYTHIQNGNAIHIVLRARRRAILLTMEQRLRYTHCAYSFLFSLSFSAWLVDRRSIQQFNSMHAFSLNISVERQSTKISFYYCLSFSEHTECESTLTQSHGHILSLWLLCSLFVVVLFFSFYFVVILLCSVSSVWLVACVRLID